MTAITHQTGDEAADDTNFRTVAQIAPNHIWTARPDGTVDWVNERAIEFFGTPDLHSAGDDWLASLHPEDRAEAGAAYRAAMADGTPFEAEYRARRHDGVYRWFLARAMPIRASDGRILRWVGTNTDIHERKLAEAAATDDRDRLWRLSQELLVVCDAAGVITATNPAVTRILGWPMDAFAGQTLLDFVHEDDLAAAMALLARLNAGENLHRFENRFRTIDGLYRVMSWAAVPEAGRIHAVGRDVTETRAAQRERDRAWTLSPVLKVIATVSGTMLAVNPAWTRLLGWTEADSIGRNVNEFLAPEGLQEGNRGLAALSQGTTMTEYQTTSVTKSGARRRIAWTTMPEDGLLYAFGRDVTAEREAAEALAASRAERDLIWSTTNDLMGVAGDDGYLKSVNPAWSRLLGYDEATLLGRPILDFVDEDDRARQQDAVARVKNGQRLVDFEDRLIHADGKRSLIAWTAEPMGAGYYVVGRDVTQQRLAEEALRQSQKMEAVGQLTGGIAHDFNNLLQGISGSLDLLSKRIAQGRLNDLDRLIAGAVGAANRASALTHRLLAFSRRQPLDPKPVFAGPLIKSMEDLLRRTMGERVAIELRLDDDLWPTICDPHQLENAVLNLAINARDAMPDGGRLIIAANNFAQGALPARDMRPGDYVAISVTDTGTGMSADIAAKAFEPFFTTKPIGQGTGLGLSMVYGFARQSDGYTMIDSRLGSGTTVRLFLPRCDAAAQAVPAVPDAASPPKADGEIVLVVEDEPVVRALIIEVLAELGFAALEAADGPEGLALLQSRRRIDLLITDVGLPGLNGRQIADAGRRARPGLKVIFMTGYAENMAAAQGVLEAGMAIITKPFALDDLAAKIRVALEPN